MTLNLLRGIVSCVVLVGLYVLAAGLDPWSGVMGGGS